MLPANRRKTTVKTKESGQKTGKKRRKQPQRPGKAMEKARETLKGLSNETQNIVKQVNARDIVTMARRSAQAALKVLTDIMKDTDTDPRARIMAAREVITRAYGQAPKHVVHTMAAGLLKDEVEQAAIIIMRQRQPKLLNSPTPLKKVSK